ncbi:3-phosphoshikimate 1-carboxyvinyltransferase [Croceitalea dokdonensis DOKDO 023]|uniref:3-phosphoshikimate 1-carboxyvinyltransferase n=1 Tax=Croceitalea dokdonensis DOKDO 023 TaxID=1300341 RepID=A0A0P7AKM1_9FLAO|nr:3-phosphoshikimate 1-carboxyvinyltransferase [Croceitalea dokdonensis]KPM32390.1 3-phosphoshikimate 1-carboxyvinyltransferase [Croceitalea dokdonensis DOKDO 023]
MKLHLSKPTTNLISAVIAITGSKSETNRLLLLQALFANIKLKNLSNSDDAEVMKKGLMVSNGEVDIHHAGTAMRFLTSYFAASDGKEVVLTGSARMKERPIKILVDALNSLGAHISYLENQGFPPLKISGRKLTASEVELPANISSQYISSLMLIAPSLENGLTIKLLGKITSVPYIEMTLGLLNQIGVATNFKENTIHIQPLTNAVDATIVVESDWSAASYFYSLVAMAEKGSAITLTSYKKDSLQGDSALVEIYKNFGVSTEFAAHAIILKKVQNQLMDQLNLDLANAPDIAQTIAVTCFGLGLGCHLTGLHTLPIKETDRLAAMKTELEKVGASVAIGPDNLSLAKGGQVIGGATIDTYNDHRMAMAFAPLCLKTNLSINDAGVVSKSYPDFWEDLKKVGLVIKHEGEN